MFKILASAGLALGLGLGTAACTQGYGYTGIDAVDTALEAARRAGVVGNSTAAHITLCLSEQGRAPLKAFSPAQLAEAFIVAQVTWAPGATTDPATLAVQVAAAAGLKCRRCWLVRQEVADSADHLCRRCEHVWQQLARPA